MKIPVLGSVAVALLGLITACSGTPSSAPAPQLYSMSNDYYYLPPGYQVVCQRRDWVLKTPEGQELKGAEAYKTLRLRTPSAVKAREPDVTGQPVFGISETRCSNGYGRWGAAPAARPPQTPDAMGSLRTQCGGLERGARGVTSPAGAVGAPVADACPGMP